MSNPLIEAAVALITEQQDGKSGPSHTIETDSGSAKVTPTHVHFNNSDEHYHSFTHDEIHKMNTGKKVRGFKHDKEESSGHEHVYTNDDEAVSHYLPKGYKDPHTVDRNLYRVTKHKN